MVDNIKPELIIINIGLAYMNGYELCDALKQKDGMEDIPVVFVTGRNFSEDKGREFFRAGAEYVTKPIEEAPFHAIVDKLLVSSNIG